jgi:hypothetical protein
MQERSSLEAVEEEQGRRLLPSNNGHETRKWRNRGHKTTQRLLLGWSIILSIVTATLILIAVILFTRYSTNVGA